MAQQVHRRFIGFTSDGTAGDTVSATATGEATRGWAKCSQLMLRLEVGGVTGGADTLDFKVQYKIGTTWVDLITMTQATAATTETKIIIRTASVGWTDEIRYVATVGAGATATGVVAELHGFVA